MGDYFDQAGQQNDQSRAALLSAIATQGSNAKAAFDQQQAQITQAKQAAIAQALAGAQQRGAPAAMQSEISNTIGSPYDERSQTLGANSATRQAQIASIGASGDSYITKANAALPALRTRVAESTATKQQQIASQVAKAQADAIRQQQQDRQALELHAAQMGQIQLQNQLAQTRAQAAAAKAAQPKAAPGVTDILAKVFGGAGGLNDFIDSNKGAVRAQKQQADNAERSSLSSLAQGGSRPAAADLNIFGYNHPPLEDSDIAEQIGQAGGLPRGIASSLYAAYQRQQEQSQAKQDTTAGDAQAYAAGSRYAAGAANVTDPPTAQQFAANVYALPGMTPGAAAKIISEFGHLFVNTANPNYIAPVTTSTTISKR